MNLLKMVCIAALVMLVNLQAQAEIIEQDINIPFVGKGPNGEVQKNMIGTEFRPEGNGPFPLILINHGVPRSSSDNGKLTDVYKDHARLFAQLGFVVINPLRPGYGKSDGPITDSYHGCDNPAFYESGMNTAHDIEAAIDYARTKPYIDINRIVLIGQSGGGYGVLALASENLPGVLGVINFAGGRGARGPNCVCQEDKLVDAFDRYAKTTHVPMLWFYSQNDHSFYPGLAQRFYAAYQKEGADVRFIVAPAYQNDGHEFFHDPGTARIWMKEVEPFLKKLGLLDGAVGQSAANGTDNAPK